MAAGADAPAGPGLGLERSPFRPPSGRGERACAVRCAAGCRSHSEGPFHFLLAACHVGQRLYRCGGSAFFSYAEPSGAHPAKAFLTALFAYAPLFLLTSLGGCQR
uniref:Uncharacterized protein n=1 Tax=Rangifer tarandus platyrhynchus TaxID=3082113 RepID=A0ACB0DYX0_RANTA|nr:unnamed protein product [Rangifer tarandus platyrhynchus]